MRTGLAWARAFPRQSGTATVPAAAVLRNARLRIVMSMASLLTWDVG
jgi:hypothetical protein